MGGRPRRLEEDLPDPPEVEWLQKLLEDGFQRQNYERVP
jgi:hypothetical protein